jgi:hypothetical protein
MNRKPIKPIIRYSRKSTIETLVNLKFDSFEEVTESSINSLELDHKIYTYEINKTNKILSESSGKGNFKTKIEKLKLEDKLNDDKFQLGYVNEYLLSLSEMKIVYLFKSLEIFMKKMIEAAFPNSDKKNIFKWENMKSIFGSNGVDISLCKGYNGCNDLRKVNNSIKHGIDISDEVKYIQEFKSKTELDFLSLKLFYLRIKPSVQIFRNDLIKNTLEELYIFKEQKLNAITNEFHERMDNRTIAKLIRKLGRKIY